MTGDGPRAIPIWNPFLSSLSRSQVALPRLVSPILLCLWRPEEANRLVPHLVLLVEERLRHLGSATLTLWLWGRGGGEEKRRVGLEQSARQLA